MKKSLIAFSFVLIAAQANAQSTLYSNSSTGEVGIGTSAPQSLLQVYSGEAQVGSSGNSCTTLRAGAIRYTANTLSYCDGTNWDTLYGSGSGTGSGIYLGTSASVNNPARSASEVATGLFSSTSGAVSVSSLGNELVRIGSSSLYQGGVAIGSSYVTIPAPTNGMIVQGNVGIGTSSPQSILNVYGGVTTETRPSIGVTSTDGIILINPAAAIAGTQQWSPRVRWSGQGWKTNSTASTQEVDAIAEIQPIQGTINPTFNWVLSGQVNGSGYSPLLTVPSTGGLNISSGFYEINGTQIAASNLLNGVTGSGNIVLAISPSLTTPNIGAATGSSLTVTGNIISTAGQMAVGTTSPNAGASLDLGANTSSLLLPGGTTGQRPSGTPGMLRYNSSTPGIEAYFSGAWNAIATSSSGSGVIKSVTEQSFTSSGTYTPNAHLVYAFVRVVGGGAGGGGASSSSGNAACGSGGGAGAYAEGTFSASSIGSSQTVTVGSGGSGGSAAGNGGAGGTSSLGSLLSASGGSGGVGGGASSGYAIEGSSGGSTTSGASFSVIGGSGGNCTCQAYNSSFNSGGAGGASAFGGGASGGVSAGGNPGSVPGAGGGGAGANAGGQNNGGGNGAAGAVVIVEYNSQ